MAQLLPVQKSDDDDSLSAEDYAMITIIADKLVSDDDLLCFFALDTLCAAEQQSEHKKYERFHLNKFGKTEFKKFFRFEKQHVV